MLLEGQLEVQKLRCELEEAKECEVCLFDEVYRLLLK